MAEAQSIKGISLQSDLSQGLETIVSDEGAIVEGVVAPHASITGRTLQEINFRQRFRMVVVAVHRQGTNQRERLAELRIQAGDTLLMMGSNEAIRQLNNTEELIMLDRPRVPALSLRAKMPLALLIVTCVIALGLLKYSSHCRGRFVSGSPSSF